ncbi:MAG: hypothetical protein V1715_11250 [bacterium]
MKNIRTFLIVTFLMVIQSCEESPEKGIPINGSFVYPLNVSNTWTYKVSVTYSDIRPDSIKWRINNYTISYQDIVTRDTTLNSIPVYEIKEWGPDISDSYVYFANETNGLFEYAYSFNSSLAKANTLKIIPYHGIFFNDSFELFRQFKKTTSLSKSYNDSIYFLEEPYMLYLYPWVIGEQWNYSVDPIIKKKVIGKETIETDAGVYDCYKVQYLYTDATYLEYIGAVGLIKTVIKVDDMPVTTLEYPEGIGRVDIKIVTVLTDVNF